MPDAIAPDGSEVFYRNLDAGRASLVEIELRPGGVSRPVRHRSVEEIWYFLAGSGEVWRRSPDRATDETRPVAPGDVVVIPTGWDFQFRAAHVRPLRFLCFTTPPWPGEDEAAPVAEGGLGPPNV
ncbi:MAG TPA: cupin domain-containing protein [Candidatus Dormibacteraeota bacterium]|nr:cupin domain-containing protein [Candidatus Dormibacteraeota bacterium]